MRDDPRLGLASGSEMDRLSKCPGSKALIVALRNENKLFEPVDHALASGMRIHECLAGNFDVALTDAEKETFGKCCELRDKILYEWARDCDTPDLLTEQRFFYRKPGSLKPLFSAQLDFVAISDDKRALIIDYKTGRKESDNAADHLQLRTEVVVLKNELPELVEIDAAIVEPWVTWNPVRARYSGDDFISAENEIRIIVEQARADNARRFAGKWCEYCPAKAYCPEALAYIQTIAAPSTQVAFVDLPRGEEGVKLWERIKVAKKILKALEDTYERILEEEPNALPGYILPERGNARRVISQPRRLKDLLVDRLTEDEIDGCATFHLDKIQEIYGLKHKLTGGDLESEFKSLIASAVTMIHDKPYIRKARRYEREKLIKDEH